LSASASVLKYAKAEEDSIIMSCLKHQRGGEVDEAQTLTVPAILL
jgi:hypothetical protein